ncbi:MAG: hypothetical protein QG622_1412 [Actinomycetota bacterium]|nr:hypothetical protein [Actinomycetota bacterium]
MTAPVRLIPLGDNPSGMSDQSAVPGRAGVEGAVMPEPSEISQWTNVSTTVLGTLGISLLLVTVDVFWRRTRLLSTLVHEVGHSVVLLVTGNWVRFLWLSPSGAGATGLPRRKLFWPSNVLGTLAGYPAPSIAGLLLARGIEVGWDSRTVLGVLLLLLVGTALFNADLFTLTVMVVIGLVGAVFFYRAGPGAQFGAVTALAWFLLLAGLRDSFSVSGLSGRQHRFGGSDQAALEELTAIHAHVWSLFFIVIALAAFVTSARWLLF